MKLVAAAIAVALVAIASRARAVEREHHIGIDAGASVLVMSDKTDVGAGIGGHWAYGLSDAFNVMVEAAWSPVALGEKLQGLSTPRWRPASVVNAGAGVGYLLDVLQWVPYAGLLVCGYALGGGTIDHVQVRPGAALALGLDYRFGRSWAAGFAFRQHMLVTDASTYPSFTQFLARFEYTFGW